MSSSLLHRWFPEAARPLIISAPMFTVANGKLAAEVTKAGGLGMLPAGLDPSVDSPHLAALDEQLTIARRLLGQESSPDTPLQIGVGFITLLATTELFRLSAVPIVAKHKPAIVWLFGSDPAGSLYPELISFFHSVGESWNIKVFVQVGTVEAAKQVVRAGADAVVAQGIDAGGHLFAKSASIITLVPEILDTLQNEEFHGREVAVVAAGGIIDGRGVAAALALGAHGVAMGTRFIVSLEADSGSSVRKTALDTQDGGARTTISSLHDAIQGYPSWSAVYGGRAITHQGIVDLENGASLEEVTASFQKAREAGDESRLVLLAGTGIGLVIKSQPAGDVVREVRKEALDILENRRSRD